mgnify:CR=1 FL=1
MRAKRLLIAVALLGLLLTAVPRQAHAARRGREEIELDPPSPALPIVYSIVGLVGIAAVAFKPSKRSQEA